VAEGTCDSGFAAVREEFDRNLAERGEVGASVCITVDGEPVVDLWGGLADPSTGRPWTTDTVALAWSCTKGATALCTHMLIDRGLLDLDRPVADYWPQFGANGKDGVTVRMVLGHQAGVPAIRAPVPAGGFADWDMMTGLVAGEEPFWQPGTRHGYHAFTFGWILGELVRRASGETLGQFFAKEVAGPLGLDFWIGLPQEVEPRVAPVIPTLEPPAGAPVAPFFVAAMTDQTSPAALVLGNTGGYMEGPDERRYHAAEIGSVGGITNGRALAGMYRPLALSGGYGGTRLVSEPALARMAATASASRIDATLLAPTRFALGFVKTAGDFGPGDKLVLSEDAFGHVGSGGSIGFADPVARMSFGYVMNKMGFDTGLDDRGQSLVDAAYRGLGYRYRENDLWAR
jgi:CubicO group peptidase (beta-lactamase class C family)